MADTYFLGKTPLGNWYNMRLLRNSRQINYTLAYKTYSSDKWGQDDWVDPNKNSNLNWIKLANSVTQIGSIGKQRFMCLKMTVPDLITGEDYNDTSQKILKIQNRMMTEAILQIPYVIADTRVASNIYFRGLVDDPTEKTGNDLISLIPGPDNGGIYTTIPAKTKSGLLTFKMPLKKLFDKEKSMFTSSVAYDKINVPVLEVSGLEQGASYYILVSAFPISEDGIFPEDFREDRYSVFFGKSLMDKSLEFSEYRTGLPKLTSFTWKLFSSSLLPTISCLNNSDKKKKFSTKEPLLLQWEGTHAFSANNSYEAISSDVSKVMYPYVWENNNNRVLEFTDISHRIVLFKVVLCARVIDPAKAGGYFDVSIKLRDENGQLLGDKSTKGHYEKYNLDGLYITSNKAIKYYSVISQYEPTINDEGQIPKLNLTFYPEFYQPEDSDGLVESLENVFLYFRVRGFACHTHKTSYPLIDATLYPTWEDILNHADNNGSSVGSAGSDDMMPWRRTDVYYSPLYKIGGKNGTIKIKTDVDSWKDGTVWVKTANGWKEASNVYTKTADGWKESK